MITVDLRSLTQPVGIVRMIATILSCISFSLVATVGHFSSPYGAWCMFTWCFCFIFTLLILILELTTLNTKVPLPWDDFTAAFPLLASLMVFTASMIYQMVFTCKAPLSDLPSCQRQIGASSVSWACFGIYVSEVSLILHHQRRQNIRSILSMLPGIMKILETFIACIIFISLETSQYSGKPELQWCVAVYSMCFIFTTLQILLKLGQLTSFCPIRFDKLVTICNISSAVLYMTAMLIWPVYTAQNRPSNCGHFCPWHKNVVVAAMMVLNFVVYTLDSAYSIYLEFFASNQ